MQNQLFSQTFRTSTISSHQFATISRFLWIFLQISVKLNVKSEICYNVMIKGSLYVDAVACLNKDFDM